MACHLWFDDFSQEMKHFLWNSVHWLLDQDLRKLITTEMTIGCIRLCMCAQISLGSTTNNPELKPKAKTSLGYRHTEYNFIVLKQKCELLHIHSASLYTICVHWPRHLQREMLSIWYWCFAKATKKDYFTKTLDNSSCASEISHLIFDKRNA